MALEVWAAKTHRQTDFHLFHICCWEIPTDFHHLLTTHDLGGCPIKPDRLSTSARIFYIIYIYINQAGSFDHLFIKKLSSFHQIIQQC